MRGLHEIEQGAAAATKGPWENDENCVMHERIYDYHSMQIICEWPKSFLGHWPNNRRFIANARTDVPEMVAHIRELRAALTDKQRLELGAERCGACGEEWIWPGEGHLDHGYAGMVCDACWGGR